jgi:signal transduction histidine kinase
MKRRKTVKLSRRSSLTAARSRAGSVAGPKKKVALLSRELSEALEQQTATGEILRVISSSPTDVQPVFNTIAQSAARLCKAQFCHVFRFDGELIHFAASHGLMPEGVEAAGSVYPMAPGRGSAAARSIVSGAVEHIPDVRADPDYEHGHTAKIINYRSIVAVPMLKDDRPIGAITVARPQAGTFPDGQIELLKTFADQAVIAIENVGLFEAEQARTRELTESLEYQTATSEVLGVISRSPSQLQPILDTIVEIAVRLCQAENAVIFKLEEGKFRLAAARSANAEHLEFLLRDPPRLDRGSVAGRAALECAPIHIRDVTLDPDYAMWGAQRLGKYRTMLGIPLLREGVPIGAIVLHRSLVRPYTGKEIELVTTFADQAVIAIENVRLFNEVQARTRELAQSVEELKALSEVGQTISSTLELKAVLNAILMHACRLVGSGGGAIYVFDEARDEFDLAAGYNMSSELLAAVREHSVRDTLVGQCAERREAVQIEDLTKVPPHPLFEMHMKVGVRALLAVPLLHQDEVLGALVVRRKDVGAFAAETVNLLQAFASQSAIAIQNARLFHEIEDKSRQLEIASQHKSQFVANMSHELRTPLAAILGYAELMQEGFYGALPDKAKATLTRVQSNGKHLLGLINSVLDIAKIEAGQFSLNLVEYALDGVVEAVRVATESLAEGKKLSLKTDVAKGLPSGLGDEQRISQVLLNLVGNAIKFTDSGEVCITASAADGHFNIRVTDTGPGIPVAEQARIFEEFHQVDDSNTKTKGGTGLGLAIAKQIIEMHGGRIWVESTLGKGATFQMELPIRAENIKGAA